MLNGIETAQLAELLKKAEWPLPRDVFHALMGMAVSVPIELGVFDKEGRILMIYREDFEFNGWHLPGTVLRDNEDVPAAIERLLSNEVGADVTAPVPLGWAECKRDFTPSRHAIALLHACSLRGEYSGRGVFFSPEHLPDDTLPHHKILVPEICGRMRSFIG